MRNRFALSRRTGTEVTANFRYLCDDTNLFWPKKSFGDRDLSEIKNLHPTPSDSDDRARARAIAAEMIEMSRALEALAGRTAEYIESTVFVFAKELRDRAQAHLATADGAVDSGDED